VGDGGEAAIEAGPGCGDGLIDLAAGEQCDPGPGAGAAAQYCSAQCQVTCPSGGLVWPKNNHCYWVAGFTSALDPDAVTLCGNAGGHVVTFAGEEEFSAAQAQFGTGKGGLPYWIDLTENPGRAGFVSQVADEPGWDVTCPGCYAATAADAKAGIARYVDPEGGVSSQGCIAASGNVLDPLWHQRPCAGVRTRVVCEREPSGRQQRPCEAGVCFDLVVTRGQKHYLYSAVPASPDTAAQACAALGGRLVVLRSRDEREQLWWQVNQLVQPLPPVSFWVGLSAFDAGVGPDGAVTTWIWDDGTPADALDANAPPWGDRQPAWPGATPRAYLRAFAGEIDDTLARNDVAQLALPFVCETTATMP
jgi:hypothetical protein